MALSPSDSLGLLLGMNPREKGDSRYRPEIDGLRAFAVIAVIANHFSKPILPSGYLGVDIFFVISGYVITSSLSGHDRESLRDFLIGFYERRVKRLLPALMAFTLMTSLAICLFNPAPVLDLQTAAASLLGLSNLSLHSQATDYFAPSTELNPFLHTWSLGVEEQFYLVFPVLVWFTGFGRTKSEIGSKRLFVLIGALSLGSLIAYISTTVSNPSAAYFLMPTRFWELGAGCLLFVVESKRSQALPSAKTISPLAILAGILLLMWLPVGAAIISTPLIVFLTALLIQALRPDRAAYRLLSHPWAVKIGLLSYSLYLWHWGVLSISRWTIGIHWWSVPLQISLMLLLAFTSYRWIETPLRRRAWFNQRWLTLVFGVALAAITSISLLQLAQKTPRWMYLGRNEPWGKAHQSRTKAAVAGTNINGRLCHADSKTSEHSINLMLQQCTGQLTKQYRRTVAFVGDSHTLSLMAAEEQVIQDGDRLVHYSFNGCPFPPPRYGIKPPNCNRFLKKAEQALLEQLNAGDVVVILNYHLSHLGGGDLVDTRNNYLDVTQKPIESSGRKINMYLDALRAFDRKVQAKGARVVLIGAGLRDQSIQAVDGEWFRPFDSHFELKQERKNAYKLNQVLREGLGESSAIQFVDPLQELPECCSTATQFKRYFRDGDHYSAYAANMLMRKLRAAALRH